MYSPPQGEHVFFFWKENFFLSKQKNENLQNDIIVKNLYDY